MAHAAEHDLEGARVTIAELAPGMAVAWIHEPRGGYGFAVPVDVVVVKVCVSRVRIEISLRDGRRVTRVVRPESLRRRCA